MLRNVVEKLEHSASSLPCTLAELGTFCLAAMKRSVRGVLFSKLLQTALRVLGHSRLPLGKLCYPARKRGSELAGAQSFSRVKAVLPKSSEQP